MKRIIALYLALLLLPVASVSAHVLEADGSIGAVMHISPDDDPIVGEPATFYFEFKDKQGKFRSESCDCMFKVLKNEQEIFSEKLFQNSTATGLDSALLSYTFPEKNVYQIKLSGSPKNDGDFQAFNLGYVLRVERGVGDPPKKSDTWQIAIFGLAVIVFLALFVYRKFAGNRTGKYNKAKSKGDDYEY